MVTFNCLPNELLINIISRLSAFDIISCRQVSHRWQTLADVCLIKISVNIGSDLLNILIESKVCYNLKSLIISKSYINSLRLQLLCHNFINIKKLVIETYTDNYDFSAIACISHLQALRHLDIKFTGRCGSIAHCIDSQMIKLFMGCRCLELLILRNCINSEITDESLFAMSHNCYNLKHIQLGTFGEMTGITSSGILSLQRLLKLRSLALTSIWYSCDFSNDSMITECMNQLFKSINTLNSMFLFRRRKTRKDYLF